MLRKLRAHIGKVANGQFEVAIRHGWRGPSYFIYKESLADAEYLARFLCGRRVTIDKEIA